jgi:hypothetical protein
MLVVVHIERHARGGDVVAPPRWTDPVGSAQRYAGPLLARGLDVRPILYAFEEDAATLLVRAGPAWGDRDRHQLPQELVALVPGTGARQLLVISGGRTTDDRSGDPEVREAVAERCVVVESAERTAAGELTSAVHLLRYRVADDGAYRWDEPLAVPGGGPWAPALRHALAAGEGGSTSLSLAEMAYALSRRGVAVAVAPGWRERYGFDGPVPPRMVRPVDRDRARRRVGHRPSPHRTGRAS